MENLLDKIFNSEIVLAIRDFFSALGEKISGIEILNRTPSKKFLLIGFSTIIALLIVVSAFSIASVNKKEEQEETTLSETTTNAVEAAASSEEIDSTFLLALTDNDKTAIHSIIIAKFNSLEEELTFSFVDPMQTVTVNESEGNMLSHLQTGGISQFLWAVSEHAGQGFNRYLIADEEGFVKLMSLLGETEIDIPSQISYNHDGISFIIEKGQQSLTADMMLKYYLYLTYSPEQNSQQIGNVLTDMIKRLVTAENDTLLEDKFCKALGYFTTDISAIDFSSHKDAVKRIASMEFAQ